jgi:hypothetical protein
MWYLYTMEFYSATKNELVISRKMDGTVEHHLKLSVRLRRPKIACSPSYVDYKPETNAVILLDMGHTLRGECTQGGLGKGKKPKT